MNDPTPLVIANLKANKTWDDLVVWLNQVGKAAAKFEGAVIACPAHPFLAAAYHKIKNDGLKIMLGSQDLSRFEQGPYTGEFAASQIASICSYSIIGHSERRQNFAEDDETLSKKIENARNAQINPIFCVQDDKTFIPDGTAIVAYEPVFAIGTGNPDTPENAKSVCKNIKTKGNFAVLYGGSVNSANVKTFLEKSLIDGVLVGTASLDPWEFTEIIESASY